MNPQRTQGGEVCPHLDIAGRHGKGERLTFARPVVGIGTGVACLHGFGIVAIRILDGIEDSHGQAVVRIGFGCNRYFSIGLSLLCRDFYITVF